MQLPVRIVLVSVGVLSLTLHGCSESDDPATTTTAHAAASDGMRYDLPPDDPRAAVVRKLGQLYEGAPVSGFITDTQRLAQTRAWVEEHRPEADERMREVEAQYLAVMLEFLDGDADLNVSKIKGLASMQLLDLWAMDADRDGELSDEEVAAGGIQMRMDPLSHPLLSERFDTDGDGTISDDERVAGYQQMAESTASRFEGVVDDILTRLADTDGDRLVSEDERYEAFLQRADEGSANWIMMKADTDGDGSLSRDEWDAMAQTKLDDSQPWTLGQMALQTVAQDFFTKMELIPTTPDVYEGLNASMPAQPDRASFDTDGDGELSPGPELDAFTEANDRFASEFREWQAGWQSRYERSRFNHAEGFVDTDGDGIATDQEWADAYPRLENDRDARLFQWMFDTDGSGSVGPSEADAFVRWAEQGHPRADVNFDGVISREDIQIFTDWFVQQSL